jgi:ABC-type glutathione transport system ATPase component
MTGSVLEVEGLRVAFDHPRGPVRAVDDVTFSLLPGERFGLAGESGSGKSTLALSILRMIKPPGHIEAGEVRFLGAPIAQLDEEGIRALRLAGVALVPQGSMNSLNPVLRIGHQIADAFVDHGLRLRREETDGRIAGLLSEVGLPAGVARMYPHELSGGMKQRACIAIAICLRPKVIIADEPTSALDVVVQRQVMATLARVQRDLGAQSRLGLVYTDKSGSAWIWNCGRWKRKKLTFAKFSAVTFPQPPPQPPEFPAPFWE